MNNNHFEIKKGKGPIVATAIHNGHETREELTELFALNSNERLREEDPYTSNWIDIVPNQVEVFHSRFEVDLNRPPEKAVYQQPEDAWGLNVWQNTLSQTTVNESHKIFDQFYAAMKEMLDEVVKENGLVVVYDIHSYNHQRDAENTFADPEGNPEINIGTGNLNREIWGDLVDRLITDLRRFNFHGRHLDVRENVKFKGGYFSKWIHDQYQDLCCPVAIEFKKFFMNEWTGELFQNQSDSIKELLTSTLEGVEEEIEKVKVRLRNK